MVVALFSNVSALRFALASAAALSFASADNSCPVARPARQTTDSNAAAHPNATRLVFFMLSMAPSYRQVGSTVLWTRRQDPAIGQRDGADQSGQRLVAGAAQLERESFLDA